MRVAIVGAGVAGLTAAHHLCRAGHACDVYERWPGLGGMAATLDVGDGHRLERYYHHWFTSDRDIVELCEDVGGGPVEWHPSSMGFFVDGRTWPFTSPWHLLTFRPLRLRERLRMGLAVLRLQRADLPVGAYEQQTAREWILREMGEGPYAKVWGPLLAGKFGSRAGDVSMSWLWAKLMLRRRLEGRAAREELLGYPSGSFEPLFAALRDSIERSGGRVLIDRPVARIAQAQDGAGFLVTGAAPGSFRRGHDPRAFTADGDPERYDGVIATVPNDIFLGALDEDLAARLGSDYVGRLRGVEYHTALCLLLELDRRFSPYYWINIADPDLPFVGLVEHTNLVDPGRYGGRRFLYVANYLDADHELLAFSPEELLDRYTPGLRKVCPEFDRSWVERSWLFREPAAQPIVTVGYRERIPPLDTGVRGLVLANTTQIYPEDRGTNYAVRLGADAAALLLAQDRAPATSA
ncbi:NAD(P)/FAD-dependent oxidoreductase [Paraconexibacter sp.]|uniref:NAD(P)/FAD-dependent oxidoreductase n=1 Tax=Paraconexibacter sp. TaxID=2949640 RepID=UPI003565E7F8